MWGQTLHVLWGQAPHADPGVPLPHTGKRDFGRERQRMWGQALHAIPYAGKRDFGREKHKKQSLYTRPVASQRLNRSILTDEIPLPNGRPER